MVAEHGVWTKDSGGDWELYQDTENKWMKNIKDIMDFHVDRTPGSFVEEKEYALAWHYRKVEPDLSTVRSRELRDILLSFTENLSVGVHQGKKIIEVKSSFINKGTAIEKWLISKKWGFIMAIGDDWTDEDMFDRISSEGYSIKVGPGITKAKYNLKNVNGVHSLLINLMEKTNA
jgi:trehalose 6-phosphate synthase/phosphatase